MTMAFVACSRWYAPQSVPEPANRLEADVRIHRLKRPAEKENILFTVIDDQDIGVVLLGIFAFRLGHNSCPTLAHCLEFSM